MDIFITKTDNELWEHKRKNGDRFIVGYSENRASKDAYNRYKGIARLQK